MTTKEISDLVLSYPNTEKEWACPVFLRIRMMEILHLIPHILFEEHSYGSGDVRPTYDNTLSLELYYGIYDIEIGIGKTKALITVSNNTDHIYNIIYHKYINDYYLNGYAELVEEIHIISLLYICQHFPLNHLTHFLI